jgi:hypothetical protein
MSEKKSHRCQVINGLGSSISNYPKSLVQKKADLVPGTQQFDETLLSTVSKVFRVASKWMTASIY